MQGTHRLVRFGLLIAGMLAAGSAAAQARYELSPYLGYRGGGTFEDANTAADLDVDESGAAGVMFSRALDPGRRLELWYSHQSTGIENSAPVTGNPLFDMDVHYLHLGGTVAADETADIHPFVSGGIGVTHFSPDRSGLDSDTRLSMSLGVGGRVYLSSNMGLRLDARWIGTLMDNDSSLFCDDGSCAVRVDGDLLSQWEVAAGVFFRF